MLVASLAKRWFYHYHCASSDPRRKLLVPGLMASCMLGKHSPSCLYNMAAIFFPVVCEIKWLDQVCGFHYLPMYKSREGWMTSSGGRGTPESNRVTCTFISPTHSCVFFMTACLNKDLCYQNKIKKIFHFQGSLTLLKIQGSFEISIMYFHFIFCSR